MKFRNSTDTHLSSVCIPNNTRLLREMRKNVNFPTIRPLKRIHNDVGDVIRYTVILILKCYSNQSDVHATDLLSVRPKFHLARHVTSWHDSTRSTCRASRACRVRRVELCCLTSSTQPKCMGSTRRTCRVETWRAKWNLGFIQADNNCYEDLQCLWYAKENAAFKACGYCNN